LSGARSRRKGAVHERTIAQRFRDVMPGATIKRGLQCRSGAEACDVEIPCFWSELKRHRRTNIKAALRQATETCPEGLWPIAVCQDDHAPATATMALDDFLDLIGEWWTGRQR